MNFWRWLGSAIFLTALGALIGPNLSALAQDKETKLEWKAFDSALTKDPYFQTMDTKTTQVMKVQGMEVTQVQKQKFYVKWTPQKKDDKGNWVVKQRIIGVDMDIDIGGNKIQYNSLAENQAKNPMTDFFNALLTLDLTFTVDPAKLTIEKIEGREEFIKKLGQTNPQMDSLLKAILSDEALKKMAEPTLAAFPTKAVKTGSTWPYNSKLDLGPIGSYDSKYTFEYKGKEKEKDKIDVKASMTYNPPDPKNKGGLPFIIEKGELTSKDGTGTALFNSTKGRFDSYTMKMKLEGYLEIDIGGMKTKVELQQDQTATVDTSDTDPVEAAKKKKGN
jgi:hypothetical protein